MPCATEAAADRRSDARTNRAVLGGGRGTRADAPPAARTLGLEFLDADPEQGTIELAFTATEDFTNPMGNVLGAFLSAMLYDTVGPALLATLGPGEFQSTLELKVTFLRPARPGRLVGKGRVVRREGDLAFLEAHLLDDGDLTVATASATARVIDLADGPGAV
ncbi:PaaI family thioesterase [Streptomyces winkii]|uniref:PaaI family thioesterase n=1 Tax=Streptomyces winkii TaxID=3051178 RepID=UPI0028D63E19|nr:PaaI family thioesterase [Streptomyces sp. DSM 40971]